MFPVAANEGCVPLFANADLGPLVTNDVTLCSLYARKTWWHAMIRENRRTEPSKYVISGGLPEYRNLEICLWGGVFYFFLVHIRHVCVKVVVRFRLCRRRLTSVCPQALIITNVDM